MRPEELAESTILPNSGRTLKQYTIKDCKDELQFISSLQSDKAAFIRGINIRKEDIV